MKILCFKPQYLFLFYRCLKISNSIDKCVSFDTCFSIQYGGNAAELRTAQKKRSRSGRVYKHVKTEDLSDLPSEIVHALDYDNALDLLVVLHTRLKGKISDNTYAVTLYDNLSGDEIRTFDLETEISDSDLYDWNIFFNDLMVICTLKRVGSGRTVDNIFTYLLLFSYSAFTFERKKLQFSPRRAWGVFR